MESRVVNYHYRHREYKVERTNNSAPVTTTTTTEIVPSTTTTTEIIPQTTTTKITTFYEPIIEPPFYGLDPDLFKIPPMPEPSRVFKSLFESTSSSSNCSKNCSTLTLFEEPKPQPQKLIKTVKFEMVPVTEVGPLPSPPPPPPEPLRNPRERIVRVVRYEEPLVYQPPPRVISKRTRTRLMC